MLPDFDAATELPYGSMAWVHLRILGHNLIHSLCEQRSRNPRPRDRFSTAQKIRTLKIPFEFKDFVFDHGACSQSFPQNV
jgi:hypothetical protein